MLRKIQPSTCQNLEARFNNKILWKVSLIVKIVKIVVEEKKKKKKEEDKNSEKGEKLG